MINISELFWCCNDPGCPPEEKEEACKQLREFFRDLMQSIYLARFVNPRIPPIPPLDPPLQFEPTPTPFTEQLANHQFLIGQLILNELDPSPQPSIFSFIREHQIQVDLAKNLLMQFERAADEMRQIVEAEN